MAEAESICYMVALQPWDRECGPPPAALQIQGVLQKCRVLGPHPDLPNQTLHLIGSPGDLYACQHLRNTALEQHLRDTFRHIYFHRLIHNHQKVVSDREKNKEYFEEALKLYSLHMQQLEFQISFFQIDLELHKHKNK